MRKLFSFIAFAMIAFSCDQKANYTTNANSPGGADIHLYEYFNYGDTGVQMAGIKMIPVKTPSGEFKVWTKRFGNNPRIKVLLLHGGPAATHQYMEVFESFFPKEGFEFYEYDQLGCGNSINHQIQVYGCWIALLKKLNRFAAPSARIQLISTFLEIHGGEFLECNMH